MSTNRQVSESLLGVAHAIASLPDEIRVISVYTRDEITAGFEVQVDDLSLLPGDVEQGRHDGVYEKQVQTFHGVEFFALVPKLREVH